MPFDAIALKCVTNELNQKLSGGRIEKIHQPERDEIWITVKNGRENLKLLISADSSNPRIYLTDKTKPNPLAAPMFCMLLRKKLEGGRIKEVRQRLFERIAEIDVECYTELGDSVIRTLVAEIMGRHSNIILTENGRILDSIKRVDMTVSSVRCILPGLMYEEPPAQDKLNPLTAEREDIISKIAPDGKAADKAIVSEVMGFSPLAAREVVYRAMGETDVRLGDKNKNPVADSLCGFIDSIKNLRFAPTVIYDETGAKAEDFSAYEVCQYGKLKKTVSFDSISGAMDEFYFARDKWERARQKSASLRKVVTNALERCRKKLVILQETLGEAENADTFRIYGELLIANLYALEDGADKAEVENYYEEGSPKVSIPLDKSKTVSQNAELYYKKYRKAKHAKETATLQMEKNSEETEYLTSVLASIDIAETEADISEIRKELVSEGYVRASDSKKKQKDKPQAPLSFEFGGYEILVGRNNRQNDQLTLKTAANYDIWLHVKNAPGSHVIIRGAQGDIPDDVIETAASLAAYYSSLRNSPMVQVDYTTVKNVKKPGGAMPGKVIYFNYKTAYVPPKKDFS